MPIREPCKQRTHIIHILFIKSTNEKEDICTDNIQVSGAQFLCKELHEIIIREELSVTKDVQDYLEIQMRLKQEQEQQKQLISYEIT